MNSFLNLHRKQYSQIERTSHNVYTEVYFTKYLLNSHWVLGTVCKVWTYINEKLEFLFECLIWY